MLDTLRALVLRILRVPPEPTVPQGARLIRVFRAAPNYYRYRLMLWVMAQIGALGGLLGGLAFISNLQGRVDQPAIVLLLYAAEALAWAGYIVQLPMSLAALRLDFDLRWYILMDRSLRIRQGVFSIQEKTMTFANIQQISIHRNPLQRMLGLADVQVRTAGGGGSSGGGGPYGGGGHVGEGMHEAFFRGVDNPEEIRTAIQERVRLHRDAGLGDPDEAPALTGHRGATVAGGGPDDVLEAARELRDEARRWRELRVAL